MEKTKISLSFVNNGKPFVIPDMTVLLQEAFMEELFERREEMNELSDFRRNIFQSRLLIWKVLEDIDETVSLGDVEKMHPDDYSLLEDEINMVFLAGRELDKKDFQKARPKKTKKPSKKN